jgi:hypothetical protein
MLEWLANAWAIPFFWEGKAQGSGRRDSP